MNKTLIGKEGYLFLTNDTSHELEIHCNNIDFSNIHNIYYLTQLSNYALIVFPDKSYVCNKFLPDGLNAIYRPIFNKYKHFLKNTLIDTYNIVADIDSYYKTDTHMNFYGAYKCYLYIVNQLNNLFNIDISGIDINIEKKECTLSELGVGIGDLTWEINLGNQILDNRLDNYYYTNDISNIYMTYKITDNSNIRIINPSLKDITSTLKDTIIGWELLSNNILYFNNTTSPRKFKTLIFYDSFLLSTLNLWMNTLSETYFIKSSFNPLIVNIIKPDYIFEFRVERFLR